MTDQCHFVSKHHPDELLGALPFKSSWDIKTKNIFSEVYFWLVSRVGREQSCIQVSRGVGRHKRVSSLPPPNHLSSEIDQMRWKVRRNGTKLYPQRVNLMYTSPTSYTQKCAIRNESELKKRLIHWRKFVFTNFARINLCSVLCISMQF